MQAGFADESAGEHDEKPTKSLAKISAKGAAITLTHCVAYKRMLHYLSPVSSLRLAFWVKRFQAKR